jgi:hypothetical protein
MEHIDIQSVQSLPEYNNDSSQITISAGRLKDIGIKCKDRLDQLKSLRANSKYEEERQKDFDAYHLVPPKKQLPYAGYPNLACPLARIGTDTFHANVMFTFGGQSGHFQILPDFLSSSHIDVAKRAADFMSYVVNYESGLYDALDKASLNCNKYTAGYLKARYVKQEVWETRTVTTEEIVPEVDPVTGEVTPKKVSKKSKEKIKRVIFEGAKSESLDPSTIYTSPLYTTVSDAVNKDYLFEVNNFNMRFLEENAIAPKGEDSFFTSSQVDKVKDFHKSAIVSRFERNKQLYDGVMIDSELALLPIELAEAHFRSDVDDDGLAEKISIIFETSSGIVLRASFAECRISKLTPRPVDGRWDGESIRRIIESFTDEWEAIRNARVAKGQWSNLPFFFFKAGGRFNPQQLTLMPGKGYPVDDPNSVNFPQPPAPDMSYFREDTLLFDLVDRVLGMGDAIQGIQGGKDQTATNTIQSVQRAGIRLATPLNRIGNGIEEHIGHLWDLNKQCGPKVKEFRVSGVGDGTPIFSKISNTDYATQVSFKINMATMYDVQMVRDTALLNYKTFISNPIFMSNPAKFYELTQNTMDAVGLKIKLPQPDQAKAKSAFEIIDLIEQGEDQEAQIGIDADEHMRAVMAFMKDEEFESWKLDRKIALMKYYDTCQILKKTLDSANLNQSGVFEGMNGMNAGGTPGMTATRNPSQTFNNMRVGNTPKGQQQNVQNGANVQGPAAPQGGGY